MYIDHSASVFHQKCFPVKPEILKYIFSLKNYLDFIIFAELKFKFHRKKCYVLSKRCGIIDIHMKTICGWRKTFWNIKLGAKVWNSSILQWTSIFQYDIGKFYRKNLIFVANRPPIGKMQNRAGRLRKSIRSQIYIFVAEIYWF